MLECMILVMRQNIKNEADLFFVISDYTTDVST